MDQRPFKTLELPRQLFQAFSIMRIIGAGQDLLAAGNEILPADRARQARLKAYKKFSSGIE
jgi:hypothetical protein